MVKTMSRKPIFKCLGCNQYIFSDEECLVDADGNHFHDIECMMEFYGVHTEDLEEENYDED